MRFPEEQWPVLEACQRVQSLRSVHNIVTTVLFVLFLLGAGTVALSLDLEMAGANDLMIYTGLLLAVSACLARLISRWLILGLAFRRRHRVMNDLLATPDGRNFLANLDILDDSSQGCGSYTGIRDMTIHCSRTASHSRP